MTMETSAFGVVHKAMSSATKERKKKAEKVQTAGALGGIAGGGAGIALGSKARGKINDANVSRIQQHGAYNRASLTRTSMETQAKKGRGITVAREYGRSYGANLDEAERAKNKGTIALKQAKKLTRGMLAANAAGAAAIGVGYQGKKIADKPKSAGKYGFGTKGRKKS